LDGLRGDLRWERPRELKFAARARWEPHVSSASEPGHPRRAFFLEGLARLVGPIADLIDGKWGPNRSRTLLRPPGALPEDRFRSTCHRCGACVEACPANAIVALRHPDERLRDTPVIDADVAACVVCTDLSCMRVCPSGALTMVASPSQIDMGLAVVDHQQCVRSSGEDCVKCVQACPMGDQAIRVDEQQRIEVIGGGCVGCGMCQLVCPTRPRAIVVQPHRTIEPPGSAG